MNAHSLSLFSEECIQRLNKVFNHYLQPIPSAPLREAMAYSLLNGGKRIRPLLVYATGKTLDARLDNLDIAAASVELIHTYSLIHDDLPAMDNSDLRRGQLTCHKAFSEALAILAGDAMQALAFQLIADHPAPLSAENRVDMLHALSKAAGPYGMVAGQAFDILDDPKSISLEKLQKTYALKTGALLSASVELGVYCGTNVSRETHSELSRFGACIGLAFQIQDDILDVERTSDTLGKPQGLDAANQKITYPTLLGMEACKQKVEELFQEALSILEGLGEKATLLKNLTEHLLKREK